MVTLEKLDLSNNNITTVPPQIKQLKNLKVLYLSFNQLSEFPTPVCEMVTLEKLDLNGNNITIVPPQIKQLKNLKELYLSFNQLSEFPTPVCETVTLEKLYLSNNSITIVPPQIKQLKNLKELDLSSNQLSEFPETVTLEKLFLSNNSITIVPPQIKQLKNLKVLYLSSNRLSEFPTPVCEMVTLENLGLSKNSITIVPPQIKQLKNLKGLYLSGNKIEEFPQPVCQLVTLMWLDLSENGLKSVPTEIRFLSNLYSLNIKENRLVQPPQEIADRGKEEIFRYFEDLVKTKATSSLRLQVQVLGETCAGKTSLVKTLTSGKPSLTAMADRTHVLDQIAWSPTKDVFLNINDFGGHDMYKVAHNFFLTKDGIALVVFDISDDSMTYEDKVGSWIDAVYSRTPELSMVLVATHADCLSSDDLDAKNAEVEQAVHSHLECTASKFKARLDELEKKEIKCRESEIKNKEECKESQKSSNSDRIAQIKKLIQTPQSVDQTVFVVSCKNEKGIDELKDELIRRARQKANILPESWLQIVEGIEEAKHSEQELFLNLTSLTKMAESRSAAGAQGGGDEQRTQDVLSFLHATGALLWFRDNPSLQEIIFHRQEVFIDILKAVLRHDMESILVYDNEPFKSKYTKPKFDSDRNDTLRRGIISKTMIECLWWRFNFGRQGLDAMLELLEKFEMCYVMKDSDKNRYHFPWLLKEDRPEDVASMWNTLPSRDELQTSTEVHFPDGCPVGLYEMAAVHIHRCLGQFKKTRRDWKDGFYAAINERFRMCFERERVGTPSNGILRLSIRGDDPIEIKKHTRKILQSVLQLVERECPGSPRDEFMVCPHCVHEDQKPPTLFDYPLSYLNITLEDAVPYQPCPDEEEPNFMASADFYYPVTRGYTSDFHCTSLQVHAEQMLENIRGTRTLNCLPKILSRLRGADILTEEEEAKIMEPDSERRLFRYLEGKNDSAFYIFCGALHDCGHAETAQMLRLPDLAVELPEDVFLEILQRLLTNGALTQQNVDDVPREGTMRKMVSVLLEKLRNSTNGKYAFFEFKNAVYEAFRYIRVGQIPVEWLRREFEVPSEFEVDVRKCDMKLYQANKDKAYPMRHNPRGIACIINVKSISVWKDGMIRHLPPRRGTEVDADKLKNLFQQMSFTVTVYNDADGLEALEIEEKLKQIANMGEHKGMDCFVLCILSHGGGDNSFYGTDGKFVTMDRVMDIFDNQNCSDLQEKPKLFFLQFCRGNKEDTGVEADGDVVRTIPTRSDMLIGYPTLPGHPAWRHTEKGSWYIQTLVWVFMNCAWSLDVCAMLNLVNELMMKKVTDANQKQMSIFESMLARPYLFFFPGITKNDP